MLYLYWKDGENTSRLCREDESPPIDLSARWALIFQQKRHGSRSRIPRPLGRGSTSDSFLFGRTRIELVLHLSILFRDTGSRSGIHFSPSLKMFPDPGSRFRVLAKHRSAFRLPRRMCEGTFFVSALASLVSGYWESNPASLAPHASVLPLHYIPKKY